MYLDKRLLRLTRGVRPRILGAAIMGLCAVFAGLARLALSGFVIAGVLLGNPFYSLILPIGGIVACTVLRGLLQFLRDRISQGTAAWFKVELRPQIFDHALSLRAARIDAAQRGDKL